MFLPHVDAGTNLLLCSLLPTVTPDSADSQLHHFTISLGITVPNLPSSLGLTLLYLHTFHVLLPLKTDL